MPIFDDQVVTESGRKSNGSYAEWYYLRTNHVTLASGPHKFDFRAYNNGYATGGAKDAYATRNDEKHESYGKFTDDGIPLWPLNFGLAYKEGEPSLYSTDYAIPQNAELTGREGGNGLLFTLDETPPDAPDVRQAPGRRLRGLADAAPRSRGPDLRLLGAADGRRRPLPRLRERHDAHRKVRIKERGQTPSCRPRAAVHLI